MAKSPEESAAYEKFMVEQDPDAQIRLVEDFLLQYPDSELKEYAYQAATTVYQAKNDLARVLTYGELTLAENEDNLTALLILASAIPETTSSQGEERDEELRQAEQYASRSLQVLARLPRPVRVTLEQWTRTKREAEASAHASLGLIALIREDFPRAELEFREAVALAEQPDPVLLYRLGLCYSFQKKYEQALEVLERAASLGGVRITGPDGTARDLVAEARDFALKSGTAAEPPVENPPTPGEPEESPPIP